MGFPVHCTNGHSFEAPSGSELEKQSKTSDAEVLVISSEECDLCTEVLRIGQLRIIDAQDN